MGFLVLKLRDLFPGSLVMQLTIYTVANKSKLEGNARKFLEIIVGNDGGVVCHTQLWALDFVNSPLFQGTP
jgi:hypothetical protein